MNRLIARAMGFLVLAMLQMTSVAQGPPPLFKPSKAPQRLSYTDFTALGTTGAKATAPQHKRLLRQPRRRSDVGDIAGNQAKSIVQD
jgi:hypothetical protein